MPFLVRGWVVLHFASTPQAVLLYYNAQIYNTPRAFCHTTNNAWISFFLPLKAQKIKSIGSLEAFGICSISYLLLYFDRKRQGHRNRRHDREIVEKSPSP